MNIAKSFPDELSLFSKKHRTILSLQLFRTFEGTRTLLPQRSVILQPSGKQKFKTVYFDTALSKGIYHLDYSVKFYALCI